MLLGQVERAFLAATSQQDCHEQADDARQVKN
jgi:hypothetical protein